ncbi:MAG: DUF4294 domain-containing protein [Sphingobacteriaceae bacterium]|nr:DUF4294 domain-containing protein [Sphingobacteriaceae bacterium]
MKVFISLLCMLLFGMPLTEAQTVTLQPKAGEFPAIIDAQGDTIPYVFLPSITIVSKRTFKGKRDQERFNRLYYNVLKAYPLAKAAGDRLRQLETELATMPERKHKAHIKNTEDDLKRLYKQQLLNLTVTQGKILIKLIDRETSRTSYDLIKDFRGTFQAFMWQSLAGLFGTNLKNGYDLQEDRDIEFILQQIEGENYRPPVRDNPQ